MHDPPIHILLVEDDDAHAMIVERAISSADDRATIDRVCDGLEAVAYVRKKNKYGNSATPTVILLDLQLPRMDGHGVLRVLKEDDELKLIPVVMLTTSSAEQDVAEAYRLHANSYLVKPANYARFRELICAATAYWGTQNRRPPSARS